MGGSRGLQRVGPRQVVVERRAVDLVVVSLGQVVLREVSHRLGEVVQGEVGLGEISLVVVGRSQEVRQDGVGLVVVGQRQGEVVLGEVGLGEVSLVVVARVEVGLDEVALG